MNATTIQPGAAGGEVPAENAGERLDVVRGGAEALRGALAVDAVVIAEQMSGHARVVVEVAGITDIDRPLIDAAMEPIAENSTTAVASWNLAQSEDHRCRALSDRGFTSIAVSTAAVRNGQAEVWILCRTERTVDRELLNVCVRHAAVIVAYRAFDAQRARVHREQSIGDVLDDLVLSASDMRDLTQNLAALAERLFGADLTGLMIWDEPRQVLQMAPGSFRAGDELVASYQVKVDNAYSNAARVFSTGWPYLSNRVVGDSGVLQDYVEAFGIERTLTLPLRVGPTMIGVLHIANKATDFTIEDLHLANLLASRIASVVELTRTILRLRRQSSTETTLSRLAVAIASGERIEEILQPAMSSLCATTDANVIALIPSGSAPIIARRNAGDFELEAAVLAGAAESTAVASFLDEPKHPGDPGRATLYVPVRFGGQRMGTVAALRLRGDPFATHSRGVLERLGSLAALAYASERYHQQRAALARHEERERIADDLHDDVAQILFAAQMTLDSLLAQGMVSDETATALVRARGLLVQADSAIRTVIEHLAPANDDFAYRLAGVIAAAEQQYGRPIHIRVTDEAEEASRHLAEAPAAALVKACREALANAAKHGGSCRVMVTLDVVARKRLRLVVVDDGPGLREPRRPGHGLTSMRRALERQGGKLDVRSGAAGGVALTATVPL